jgi:hypothetical protein
MANELARRQQESRIMRWLIGIGVSIAFMYVIQLIVFGLQARRLKQAIDKMEKIAGGQTRDVQASIAATEKAANAAQTSANATVLAERAYVTMSHQPPGLVIESSNAVSVTIRVKNVGRTPARISAVVLKAIAFPLKQPLPDAPDYRTRQKQDAIQGFLVSGDEFSWRGNVPIEGDLPNKPGANATHALYLIGYVDYIDQFDVRHRAGYARVHDPSVDDVNRYSKLDPAKDNLVIPHYLFDRDRFENRNNLRFVTQPRYNDDVEIDEEGNPKT